MLCNDVLFGHLKAQVAPNVTCENLNVSTSWRQTLYMKLKRHRPPYCITFKKQLERQIFSELWKVWEPLFCTIKGEFNENHFRVKVKQTKKEWQSKNKILIFFLGIGRNRWRKATHLIHLWSKWLLVVGSYWKCLSLLSYILFRCQPSAAQRLRQTIPLSANT